MTPPGPEHLLWLFPPDSRYHHEKRPSAAFQWGRSRRSPKQAPMATVRAMDRGQATAMWKEIMWEELVWEQLIREQLMWERPPSAVRSSEARQALPTPTSAPTRFPTTASSTRSSQFAS